MKVVFSRRDAEWFGPHVAAGWGGVAHWPDAGGVNDQAAWVVDGFAVLGRIDAALDAEQRQPADR